MVAIIGGIGLNGRGDLGSSTFDFTDDLSKKQLASRVETPPTGLGMTNVRPAIFFLLCQGWSCAGYSCPAQNVCPAQILAAAVAAVDSAFGPSLFGAALA